MNLPNGSKSIPKQLRVRALGRSMARVRRRKANKLGPTSYRNSSSTTPIYDSLRKAKLCMRSLSAGRPTARFLSGLSPQDLQTIRAHFRRWNCLDRNLKSSGGGERRALRFKYPAFLRVSMHSRSGYFRAEVSFTLRNVVALGGPG